MSGEQQLDDDKAPNPTPMTVAEVIRRASGDPQLADLRTALGRLVGEVFANIGRELHVAGHIIGSDRLAGRSPWGHGSDEVVAVSMILRIAAQLVSASTDLIADGRRYAAAALTRQLVEVEYLAWAFEARDDDATRWLRSTRAERETFFRPARLRHAAQGKFRGTDYSHHCELGGHPVPRGAVSLLDDAPTIGQLMLSDTLTHASGIWGHVVGWADAQQPPQPVATRGADLSASFEKWRSVDPLLRLPPPPDPAD